MGLKQKIFCKSNGKWVFLSPYIHIYRVKEGQLLLARSDTEGRVLMTAARTELLRPLIEKLAEGIPEYELTEYLRKSGITDTEKWIDICRKEGIIE